MSTNSFKQNALHATRKLSLAVTAGLLMTLAFAAQVTGQDCPNARNFGERPGGIRREGETRRVRVQAVYFRTDDKNAFISEANGVHLSPSTKLIRSADFRDQLAQLIASGKAEVNSRRGGALYMGDTAALDRGPQSLNQNASYFDLATPSLTTTRVRSLDRYTTFSVFRRKDEDFYRVGLTSWFVEIRPDGGGRMTVDLDAGVFLRPGETQIFKFLSDFEVERTGSARTYVALTLVPLGDADEGETAQVTAAWH